MKTASKKEEDLKNEDEQDNLIIVDNLKNEEHPKSFNIHHTPWIMLKA